MVWVLAICGPTGSGKTTFAKKLAQTVEENGVRCAVLHCDGYYRDHSHLSVEARKQTDWDDPDRINFDELARAIAALRRGEPIFVREYCFQSSKSTLSNTPTPASDVVIVEGLYACHESLLPFLDEKIFLNFNTELCLKRRHLRDSASRTIAADALAEKRELILAANQTFVLPQKQHCRIVLSEKRTRHFASLLAVIHAAYEDSDRLQSLLKAVHAEEQQYLINPLLKAMSACIAHNNWGNFTDMFQLEAASADTANIKLTQTTYSLFSPHPASINTGHGLPPEDYDCSKMHPAALAIS